MDHCAYTLITTDPVLLNLTGCKDWGTLHQRIRKTFGFPPDYYGENWDAMPQELREYAAPMREIFRDLREKCSWIAVTYR